MERNREDPIKQGRRMSRNRSVRNATDFLTGIMKLAFVGIGGVFLLIVSLLLLNLLLYAAAHVTKATFDLLKALFGG